MVYDLFLVLPLIMAVVAVAMLLKQAIAGQSGGMDPQLQPYLVQLLAVLSVAGFYTVFWLRGGQTLGMQAWRIKLVSVDGGPVTVSIAAKRIVCALLSVTCFGLGYLWCLVDKQSRYWHDHLSGSELRLLPKKQRQSASATQ